MKSGPKLKRVSNLLKFLFLVFSILKLTEVIDWSWWWVTSPIWSGLIIGLIVLPIIIVFVKPVRNMQHDISHCNQGDCPKKAICYRYQAHLEAQKQELEYVHYLMPNKADYKKGNCEFYWEIEL